MTDATQGQARTQGGASYLAENLREYGMLMALIAIVAFFTLVVRKQAKNWMIIHDHTSVAK